MSMRASIEISPAQIARSPDLLGLIPIGTRVYLVDVGTTEPAVWGRVAWDVVAAGLEPVPHIAARRLPSRAALQERLERLGADAGVRDVLLIGGDIAKPVGPFASSMAVLESGVLDRCGITRIGIAGHPEGSPDISPEDVHAALTWKNAWRRRTGADMRIVTQFNFDPASAIRWSMLLAAQGFDIPIHLGIAGPTTMTSLMKYAALCGVRASASFALKRSFTLASLAGNYSPEPYARAIEQHVANEPASLVRQLHVFPFGGLKLAAPWLVGRGSWVGGSREIISPPWSDGARAGPPRGEPGQAKDPRDDR